MFPIDFYRTGNIYENSSVSPLMAMKKYRFKTVQFGSLFTIYIRVLYTSFVLGDWHGCALVQHRALEDNICQILYILCPFFFFFFVFLIKYTGRLIRKNWMWVSARNGGCQMRKGSLHWQQLQMKVTPTWEGRGGP